MNKGIEYYKKRWKETRLTIGYIFWIGTTLGTLFLSLLGLKIGTWIELIALIIMHFFGFYLVLRYQLFAYEVDDE